MQSYSVDNIVVGIGGDGYSNENEDSNNQQIEGGDGTEQKEDLIKGGYSAYELLKVLEQEKRPNIITGGGVSDLVVPDGLKERIKDLHIPVGLVTKHYYPIVGGSYTHDVDMSIPKHIIEQLEANVFVGNKTGGKTKKIYSNSDKNNSEIKDEKIKASSKKTRKNKP